MLDGLAKGHRRKSVVKLIKYTRGHMFMEEHDHLYVSTWHMINVIIIVTVYENPLTDPLICEVNN